MKSPLVELRVVISDKKSQMKRKEIHGMRIRWRRIRRGIKEEKEILKFLLQRKVTSVSHSECSSLL